MLITFKSRAAGDVIMFGEVAQTLLEILGKDRNDSRGIITLAQLPGAIATLRAAIAADKARAAGVETDEEDEDAPRGMAGNVALWQRAAPLLELCEYSLKDELPVIWE